MIILFPELLDYPYLLYMYINISGHSLVEATGTDVLVMVGASADALILVYNRNKTYTFHGLNYWHIEQTIQHP